MLIDERRTARKRARYGNRPIRAAVLLLLACALGCPMGCAAQTAEARLNYAAVALDLLRVLDGRRPLYPAN
jgi:hypothetical protein